MHIPLQLSNILKTNIWLIIKLPTEFHRVVIRLATIKPLTLSGCDISMFKRNLGDSLFLTTYWAQQREMNLLALTHNIMVILLVVKELFYKA